MTDNIQTEIRDLIDARNAAVGRADADAVVASLAHDAVVYDLQPPLAYRAEAARDIEGLNQWFDTWTAAPKVTVSDVEVRVNGDLAVANGFSHMTGTKKAEGPTDLWFRATIVLERQDGRWQIVHEHNSVPMKMDGSGLAAIDLKP